MDSEIKKTEENLKKRNTALDWFRIGMDGLLILFLLIALILRIQNGGFTCYDITITADGNTYSANGTYLGSINDPGNPEITPIRKQLVQEGYIPQDIISLNGSEKK